MTFIEREQKKQEAGKMTILDITNVSVGVVTVVIIFLLIFIM